jgi:hypothetical protein
MLFATERCELLLACNAMCGLANEIDPVFEGVYYEIRDPISLLSGSYLL